MDIVLYLSITRAALRGMPEKHQQMNAQVTLQLMQKMKLNGKSVSYEAMLDLPVDKVSDTYSSIAVLIDAELQNRAHKRTSKYFMKKILEVKHEFRNRNLTTNIKKIKMHSEYN